MPSVHARDLACEVCQATVRKRPRSDRRVLCLECACKVMAQAAAEMRTKSGPAWESWLASNADGAPGHAADT